MSVDARHYGESKTPNSGVRQGIYIVESGGMEV